jgi:Transposase DNA-binding
MIDWQATMQAQHPEVRHDHWINSEIDDNAFADARLARRVRVLLGQLAQAPGQRIALVVDDNYRGRLTTTMLAG